jgi:hypothetical protein
LKVGSAGTGYLYVDEADTGLQFPTNWSSSSEDVTELNTDPKLAKHAVMGDCDSSGLAEFGNDYQYQGTSANTECLPFRGGDWLGSASAGVFALDLIYPRAYSGTSVGFRAALSPVGGIYLRIYEQNTRLKEPVSMLNISAKK